MGGESGPGARPFDMQWARSVVQQCREADVACFVKQIGHRPMLGTERWPIASRKGEDPDEWPPDLRVRQWPDDGATRELSL